MAGPLEGLRRKGVLGMNRRNVHYIGRYNDRRLFPLVDDKLQTKFMARELHVEVPGLIGLIKQQHDVRSIAQMVSSYDGFVIKPAKGSGGKGILVITGREGDDYMRANGKLISLPEIERHISNILGGLFSLGGATDIALVEDLVRFDPSFKSFSHEGVPDVRLIVFQGFPVMAMMRLATHESGGRANLHQGAVGVGLHLTTGRAIGAVQSNRTIQVHPDTGAKLEDLTVPFWSLLLEIAAKCYDMTALGYLGADIVIDETRGPLLLELNARPGLSIQIANRVGLLPRLRHVERGYSPSGLDAVGRAQYAAEYLAPIGMPPSIEEEPEVLLVKEEPLQRRAL